jgi:PEP-CTERM motif-containing protein
MLNNARTITLLVVTLLGTSVSSHSALLTFNSPDAASNTATRDAWLAAIGIAAPDNLVDFEIGFANGQNISGVGGLFPLDLVITDTSGANAAIIRSGAGIINGSNPIGVFALTHNELAFLEFDFSANPVDYFGFFDIDQAGTTGIVTFEGGATAMIGFETTEGAGDSAEFFGIFRNDMPRIIRVQLDASGDGRWGVDNLQYGVAAVPEPATVSLMGIGLAVATAIARRAGGRRR